MTPASPPGCGDPAFRERFWARVTSVTRSATACGALEPIPTRIERIDEGGIPFLLRRVDRLALKPRPSWSRPDRNPFDPWEPELFVTDVSDTHVALLNKFNVLEHHVLVVTREFRPQDEAPDAADFAALWACIEARDGLGFYNGGREAGASQPHRHLQWVPLPMTADGPAVPIEAVLPHLVDRLEIRRFKDVPFGHGVVGLDARAIETDPGRVLLDAAGRLLSFVGRSGRIGPGSDDLPYNLLVTRRWMMAVPRAGDRFETISVNALGFAGALLVRTEREGGND